MMEGGALEAADHVVLIAFEAALVVEHCAGEVAEGGDDADEVFAVEQAVVMRVGCLVGQSEEGFDLLSEILGHGDKILCCWGPIVATCAFA